MPAGQQNKLAINNGTAWGTAADCNKAGAGLIYNSLTVDTTRDSSPVEGIGMTVSGQRNASNLNATGTLSCPFTYTHMPRLFTLFAASGAATGSDPYTHTFTSPLVERSSYITIAEEIPQVGGATKYREINSAMGTSFTLSGEVNSTVMLSMELLCDKLVTPATVNSSSLSAATLPASDSFMRMAAADAGFFTISEYGDAGGLANLAISGFSFTYNIPREGGDFSTGSATIGLPDETGIHVGTLEVTIPAWATTDYSAGLLSDQAYSARFDFPSVTTGGTACSGSLRLPNLRLVSAPATTDGPGKIAQTLTFDVLSDPSGGAHSQADTTGGAAWELAIINSENVNYDSAIS